MAIPEFDATKIVLPVVMAIIFLVVGLVASNITYGIGIFVLNQINSTMGGSLVPLIPTTSLQIVSVIFTILGVSLVGAGVGVMIYFLIKGVKSGSEA